MNDSRHNGPSEPGLAGAKSGRPGSEQPRKPRIEVLRPASAAVPAASVKQNTSNSSIDPAGITAPGASPPRASWAAIDQPEQVDTLPVQRRRGLFRSRSMLLVVVATIVIAGTLLGTYLSSERDASSYAYDRTGSAAADPKGPGDRQTNADSGMTRVITAPSASGSIDNTWAEGEPVTSSASRRRAARVIHRAAVAETSESPAPSDSSISDDERSASATVRAFYSALSAGDGASAAQLVVPAKRQSGPLSADALTRYYSSFRRPLQVRSLTRVDANTFQVAYDYVLADGGVCRGSSAVEVVQGDGVPLVSRIRTRGPC